jgi:hypothetical protein
MIAQGAQFQAPVDPFAQYGKLQQLQQNQQANALNQMKMDEYVRGQQESNALRQFLPGLNEGNRNQLLGFGTAGQGVYKALGEGDTQRRLADQAKSQADLNEAKILTDVVARTRNVVAGINPNDAPSYMALRESVLAQYPKLAPYMPNAWNANVQQSLIVTADSLLERQKPEPGFTLSPGQVRYPAGYAGVVNAPAAAPATAKPPEKLEIMKALGYPLTPEGDAAYEAARHAPPTVAAPPAEIAAIRALGIPETPEGLALYTELRTKTPTTVTAPPVAIGEMRAFGIPETPEGFAYYNELKTKTPVAAPQVLTTEERNARAIALGAGPEGSLAYNEKLQKELARLTTKAEPVTAPPAASTEMKNADAFARLKGEPGTPAYNAEFAKQMARLTAKTSGGEGGGGAGGAAGTGTVEVVNPKDPTKTIIVTKARAVAEGLTPAKAMEGLTPVQKQKLEASYPIATTALKGHQNKTAQFIKDLVELRDHPGLDSITGFVAGNFRGVSGPGRAAVAKYDKVVAKGGFQTLQEMRDMSKTGGALGNVSDKENEQLKKSFAAIDRKQDAADVRIAIDDLIKELQGGVGRLQDAYDLTYEYRTGRTAPAASGVAPSPGFGRATVVGN